ncbi:MAG: hypothetical protein MJ236_02255 [Clostridia bacterium]|nr:hypothetical protein [Clostridia bacterium]
MRIADIGITNSEIARRVDENIHSSRDRAIIKRRYIDGVSLDELSIEFELSYDAIKKIIRKNDDLFSTK